jgi:imidazolonepropionase-like amidohydrolase
MNRGMFVVERVRVFDGDHVMASASVLVDGQVITGVSERMEPPHGAHLIDGRGMTLIPGLIDAHTHAKPPALEQALVFGVTTELDMFSMPDWMLDQRRQAELRNDMADVRSASIGATVPGGHPGPYLMSYFGRQFPRLTSVAEVPQFVEARVAEGADYIKLIIDDGGALGVQLPTLTAELARVIVDEAHRQQKMAVAHVMTTEGARLAIDSGVDALVHVFMDTGPAPVLIESIARSGAFVVTTISTLGALAGDISGAALAGDDRVASLVTNEWRKNLCACRPRKGPASMQHALEVTAALYRGGVDVLAGTDAAHIGVPGTAHGVSLHGELSLLVRAGLTPTEALRSATSRPARRFGLSDRGRIAPGLQADMVLIDGDPTSDIADTLSIHTVWRRGQRVDRDANRRAV